VLHHEGSASRTIVKALGLVADSTQQYTRAYLTSDMSVFRELRRRLGRRKSSFEPCLPRPAKQPPAGPDWIHEIKHDGFRILAWRTSHGVRLLTRNGYDFTDRFTFSAMAIKALPARSCVVDCEAIVCNDDGLSVFDLIRNGRKDHLVSLCAFDLLELNAKDLRDWPLEDRKTELKKLLRKSHPGIAFNRYFDVEGSIVFHHACKLGCEGIVSKRLGSPYRAGRSADWIKVENPASPAVRRESEVDWTP
jgi:bifunctional non-homologous end joining protein LigD